MRRILLLSLVVLNSSFLFASSLDDAAIALSRGEVSEEALKNNFSKVDFESIMERYKTMKLERAKRETEKQRVNELLKKRNIELEQEIKNQSLSKKDKNRKVSLDQAIINTFKGVYGDNPVRIKKLQELGFTKKEIQEIQKAVNKLVEQGQEKQ